ncbi:ABC transporter permease [Streptomyces sp. CNZ287]|uniref:ABC transporter permease n=1 Tax=Streptomyces sp. B22F1 TaxID=3153566 RepID=UPI00119BB174
MTATTAATPPAHLDDRAADVPGPLARLAAIGRAELTLMWRSKLILFGALVTPAGFAFATRSAVEEMDLSDTGLTAATVVLPSAVVFALIFVVYANLVIVYVARREELVLKRLRTGLLTDRELLAGAALPALCVALGQCLVLAVAVSLAMDSPAPEAPHLAVLGVLLGMAMLTVLAAATAAVTKSAESAQLTSMPLLLVSMFGSGLFVPFEVLPDSVAEVAQRLPLSPVVELVRGGWTGELGGGAVVQALAVAAAWIAAGAWAVRRWFRWEPRG